MLANLAVGSILFLVAEHICGDYLIKDRGASFFFGIFFFYLAEQQPKSEEFGTVLLNYAVILGIFQVFAWYAIIPVYNKYDLVLFIPWMGIFIMACIN